MPEKLSIKMFLWILGNLKLIMTFSQKILSKPVRKCGQYKAIEINFLKNAGTNSKMAKVITLLWVFSITMFV